jgi:hypothetical protein
MTTHVFVESNWVFGVAAPAHKRLPLAERLLERTRVSEVSLYIPSICLREGEDAIRRKCQPSVKELQEFRRWAANAGKLTQSLSAQANEFLEAYVGALSSDLATLSTKIDELASLPGVNVFALNDDMLARAISLRSERTELRPFDEAILAAVLVRAEEVSRANPGPLFFCSLDGDLWPVDRRGSPREPLQRLYNAAGITVLKDFAVP